LLKAVRIASPETAVKTVSARNVRRHAATHRRLPFAMFVRAAPAESPMSRTTSLDLTNPGAKISSICCATYSANMASL